MLKTKAVLPTILAFIVALMLTAAPAFAQQTTGVPGSPDATTTVDGRYLPNPPAPFDGMINMRAQDSRPYWPPRIMPPKGAPNVLLILLDDAARAVRGAPVLEQPDVHASTARYACNLERRLPCFYTT